MKKYELSIMNTVVAGILVIGIIAACFAAGQGVSAGKRAPSSPEAAVLEI